MYFVINYHTKKVLFQHELLKEIDCFIGHYYPDMKNIIVTKQIKY